MQSSRLYLRVLSRVPLLPLGGERRTLLKWFVRV